MNKRKAILTGLVAILALVLAVTAAFAQGDEADEAGPESQETLPARPHGKFGGHGFGDRPGGIWGGPGERDEQLADALDISVEELQAARLTVYAQRLESLVDEGVLDADQADLMLALKSFQTTLDRQALLAEALGMEVDELEAARDAGQTLGDLLEAQELTVEAFREARQAAFEAAVGEAVDAGVLTEAQAEEILSGAAGLRGPGGPGRHPGHGVGPRRGFSGSGPFGPDAEDGASAPLLGTGA